MYCRQSFSTRARALVRRRRAHRGLLQPPNGCTPLWATAPRSKHSPRTVRQPPLLDQQPEVLSKMSRSHRRWSRTSPPPVPMRSSSSQTKTPHLTTSDGWPPAPASTDPTTPGDIPEDRALDSEAEEVRLSLGPLAVADRTQLCASLPAGEDEVRRLFDRRPGVRRRVHNQSDAASPGLGLHPVKEVGLGSRPPHRAGRCRMIVRGAYQTGSRRVRLHCPLGIERRQGTIGRYQAMSPRITRKRSLLAADGVRYDALRRRPNPHRRSGGCEGQASMRAPSPGLVRRVVLSRSPPSGVRA
jgi:hypothetical protein